MTPRDKKFHEQLQEDLKQLKLTSILEQYSDLLDEAARKNTSMLEVLSLLIGGEAAAKSDRALQRRIAQARLPRRKTLKDYKFEFPKRIPKQKVLRLFDCEFVSKNQCSVLIGGTGTGKTHLLAALGYVACEKGIRVKFTRVIDMINVLTTAQINGTLEKRLREYIRPDLLLLDELGYLPIDKRGADLMFQVVAARYESGSIVVTTNRKFRDWGKTFDVDNTLATAMIDRLAGTIESHTRRSFCQPLTRPRLANPRRNSTPRQKMRAERCPIPASTELTSSPANEHGSLNR